MSNEARLEVVQRVVAELVGYSPDALTTIFSIEWYQEVLAEALRSPLVESLTITQAMKIYINWLQLNPTVTPLIIMQNQGHFLPKIMRHMSQIFHPVCATPANLINVHVSICNE